MQIHQHMHRLHIFRGDSNKVAVVSARFLIPLFMFFSRSAPINVAASMSAAFSVGREVHDGCNAPGILVQGGMASILCGKASRHRQPAVSENAELDVKVYIGGDA